VAVGGRFLSAVVVAASSALRGDRRCSKEDLGAPVPPPEGRLSLSLSLSLSLLGYLIADGGEGTIWSDRVQGGQEGVIVSRDTADNG
jgi:hypothetical protein